MKVSEDREAGVLEIEILTAGRLTRGRRPEEFIYSQFLESKPVKPRCLQPHVPPYPQPGQLGSGIRTGTDHLQLPRQGWGRSWL